MTYDVIQSDVLEFLRGQPEASYDGCFCDPPYALTDNRDYRRASPSKEQREKIGGFMGCQWDNEIPGPEVWAAVLRVLKPGAWLLAFGSPRTHHWLMVNLELAGFRLVDCLCWLHGQGFPKSMDISKAIDKRLGAGREVIERTGQRCGVFAHSGTGQEQNIMDYERTITAPATPEAARWAGYGTALKPAVEYVVLAQRPVETTFADNAIKWGTGGINIDGTRVGTETITTCAKEGMYGAGSRETMRQLGFRPYTTEDPVLPASQHTGRFPANLLLSHHPDCEYVGETKIKEGKANGERNTDQGACNIHNWGTGKIHKSGVHYGEETIEKWSCVDGCPVRLLDQQSGNRRSSHGGGNRHAGESVFGTGGDGGQSQQYFDSGGVSRFFYCAKASKKERNLGCEDLPEVVCKTGCGGGDMPIDDQGRQRDRFKTVTRNNHPCVKPLALCRYLATLILPPARSTPRRLLVPFSGSASECIGGLQAGWDDVTGIEREAGYCEIARKRIEGALSESY